MVKNLKDEEAANTIENALAETRVDYEVNIDKRCVIVEGNSDMVAIARKTLGDIGFIIL